MILHTFESQLPKTPFAPQYRYFIYESMIENINIDELKEFCLLQEKEIMEKYPAGADGQTGLGLESLTSRFMFYNLFQIQETEFLKKIIKNHHDKILNSLGIPPTKIYGQSWINVLRKGESIQSHRHGTDNYSYLSGNICVYSKNTFTHYKNPYTGKIFSSENIPGKLTLFPGWLEHYTDLVEEDYERITIGLDIVNEIGFKEDIYDHKKHRWPELI